MYWCVWLLEYFWLLKVRFICVGEWEIFMFIIRKWIKWKQESIPVGCVKRTCANRTCLNSHQMSVLGGGEVKWTGLNRFSSDAHQMSLAERGFPVKWGSMIGGSYLLVTSGTGTGTRTGTGTGAQEPLYSKVQCPEVWARAGWRGLGGSEQWGPNAPGSCVMVTLAPLWTEWLTDGPTWLKALTSRNFIKKFSIALGDRKVQSQKKGPMKDTPGIFTYLHLQSPLFWSLAGTF